MASSLPSRRIGLLFSWSLSEHGGYGKILVPATSQRYFIHRSSIVSGDPLPGSSVSFLAAPPVAGAKYPQAVDCVIDNTQVVKNCRPCDKGGVK